MRNITELRNELVSLFDQLKGNTIDQKTAKEMNSTAGKIIGSAKLELDYNKQIKNNKKIDFLES
jgi:5S rRNA maturation endonuclease (ribonuclease M5)